MLGWPQQFDRPAPAGLNSSFILEPKAPRGRIMLPESYVDPLGTAGAVNTAQIVKSVILRANSVSPVRPFLELEVLFKAVGATNYSLSITLGGVAIWNPGLLLITHTIGSLRGIIEYTDPNHGHVTTLRDVDQANNAVGVVSNCVINQAGFAWGQDQAFVFNQTAVVGDDLVVMSMEMYTSS